MFQLVFPPAVWQMGIPELVRSGRRGVAHLARNSHGQTAELIAQRLLPLPPEARGGSFGPLDDLLIVDARSSVQTDDADRFLESFRPAQGQLVAALVLGFGPAAGRWEGTVWSRGRQRPLAGFHLIGPAMRHISRRPDSSDEPVDLRWSRTRGALGDAVWRHVRSSRVAVIGASRNGSVAAATFAMLGVRELLLVDPDREEIHNLDATLGATPGGVGRAKVHNRRRFLRRIRPDDLVVDTLPMSFPHPDAVERLRGFDLVCTCVDHDTARLGAAMVTNSLCLVHLDIGAGVFASETGADRVLGADVRLLLPGQACVVCLGGLRNLDEAHYEISGPTGALHRGPPATWQEQRAGSLVTVNSIACNLGIQMWLDLLRGTVTESRWCHLQWQSNGVPAVEVQTVPSAVCSICRPIRT